MHSVKNTSTKKKALIGVSILALLLAGLFSYRQLVLSGECTSVEKYDVVRDECYFDCETDEECEKLSKQVDAELNEAFKDSKYAGSENAKPAPHSTSDAEAPASKPADGKLFTTETTGSETKGKVYTVQPDGSLLPTPSAEHKQLWDFFVRIVSRDAVVRSVASFEVFSDGNNDSAASVWRSQDPAKWHMNLNAAYKDDKKDLVHTLVHEYGHIVTLSGDQVPAVGGACPRLELAEGCANANSYIQGFYTRFWKKYGALPLGNRTHAMHETTGQQSDQYGWFGSYDEAMPGDQAPTPQPTEPQSAYTQEPPAGYVQSAQDNSGAGESDMPQGSGDPNEFVSEYAATNIGEDLAETWAYFVLRAKPTGNAVKDQKVRYFYDFPELVTMRDRLRAGVGSDLVHSRKV